MLRRTSMPSSKTRGRLHRDFGDSDDVDAENVELLPFANISGSSSPLRRHNPPRALLSDALYRVRDWAENGPRSRQWTGLLIRTLYLLLLAPIALVTQLLLLLFGTGPRRTRAQQTCRLFCSAWALAAVGFGVVAFLIALFSPSYTYHPPQYTAFRQVCEGTPDPGRANPLDQRVFIAATLYDPEANLLRGPWSHLVLRLIDLIGPQNTHLSIYVSDSGDAGVQALIDFATRVHSPHTFLHDAHVSVAGAPIINMPDGAPATKRVEYLARARNVALSPLEHEGPFDKVFFLNDVFFDPIEAAQLIFLTNTKPYDLHSKEKSNYKAACAVDLANPFKYRDTFATRDLDGYAPGLPVYPWFTTSGNGESRQDVLDQKDAVRVKSCWGGMVAFDARFFQRRSPKPLPYLAGSNAHGTRDAFTPLPEDIVRFRSVPELDVEYSECCLIHADLAAAAPVGIPQWDVKLDGGNTGIFMNPYIRTAYNEWVFDHNWVGRRFEKVLLPFQALVDWLVGLPRWNARRTLAAGEHIVKTVWEPSSSFGIRATDNETFTEAQALKTRQTGETGRWVQKSVPATQGEFCALPSLMVRRLTPLPGEKSWEMYDVPLSGEMARLNVPVEA